MNILVIDKTAVIPAYRKKWEYPADYDDIRMTLLVPNRWKENYRDIPLEKADGKTESKLRIIPGSVIFPGYENRGFYITSLIKAFRKSKPDIIHLMEEPYSLFALQTILVKKILAKKAKIIFYTYDNISYMYQFPYKFSFVYKSIERFTLKNADCALCSSEEIKKLLILKGFIKPVEVVYPCFDFNFLKKSDTGNLKEYLGLKGIVIGYTGRIIKEKGLETLLKACSSLSVKYSILLVGSGSNKENLLKLADELGIGDKLMFVSSIDYKEIPSLLSLMDIFVLPSITTRKWKEQFGRVIIEAMACEVPVIGSTSGAIPEVVNDAGLIFKENDPHDLKNKIMMLIKDSKFRNNLKNKGKEYSRKFSVENHSEIIYNLYKKLLSG